MLFKTHSIKEKMKEDYWNVSDEQVFEKTGENLAEWLKNLTQFHAEDKK